MRETITLIDDGRSITVPAAVREDGFGITPEDFHAALGWELKPQGLCRGPRCVPRRPGDALVAGDGIDLARAAALLDRPLALDVAERAACLGIGAAERGARLASLEAPDFTLPDLGGRLHALSAYRGTKVLLIAYASW